VKKPHLLYHKTGPQKERPLNPFPYLAKQHVQNYVPQRTPVEKKQGQVFLAPAFLPQKLFKTQLRLFLNSVLVNQP